MSTYTTFNSIRIEWCVFWTQTGWCQSIHLSPMPICKMYYNYSRSEFSWRLFSRIGNTQSHNSIQHELAIIILLSLNVLAVIVVSINEINVSSWNIRDTYHIKFVLLINEKINVREKPKNLVLRKQTGIQIISL